ncbi:MAG: Rieske 2Fe-2S domain-containing protein, partial [Defluviicoccus sp.]|nr:Rieske 2Fe-2S domain-containing protein [Defluviicoccus sp.]
MDRPGFDRIPYAWYRDEALYRLEIERIFEGGTWCFLGLEAEIPNAGDFRRTVIGEAPVVYNRAEDGRVHAFVNRCSHRGAL